MLVDRGGPHATVFHILIREHRAMAAMFEEVLALPSKEADARRTGFGKLARMIRAHARAEEEILFPLLDGSYELGHRVHQDQKEHAGFEAAIVALESMAVDGPQWTARLAHLAEALALHFADEEEVLFPHAHCVISDPNAAALLDIYELDRDRVLAMLGH